MDPERSRSPVRSRGPSDPDQREGGPRHDLRTGYWPRFYNAANPQPTSPFARQSRASPSAAQAASGSFPRSRPHSRLELAAARFPASNQKCGESNQKRRGRDSNSRYTNQAHNGFRDRRIQPLCHPSRGDPLRLVDRVGGGPSSRGWGPHAGGDHRRGRWLEIELAGFGRASGCCALLFGPLPFIL